MYCKTILSLTLAGFAVAKSAPRHLQQLHSRTTEFCGQWDNVKMGDYILYNNLWGMSNADSGSQCTTAESISGNTLKWSVEWSWSGGNYHVKSYPNAVLQADAATVSSITEMPTKWSWSYTGSGVVANVAYDLFSNSDCGSTPQYEIMVWLGALGGAGPISSTGSTIDTPTINGVKWNLYQGSHSQMQVYSFVAQSTQRNFDGDLQHFLSYLMDSQGYPGSQCLYSIGAGTEPFVGSNAKLEVSGYSVSVSTGGSSTTDPSDDGDSTTTTVTSGSGTCAPKWGQCGGQGWSGPTCCSSGTCTSSGIWYSQCV